MRMALELRQLHKRFGAEPIIQGVSLSVAAGQRMALVGPNGAGKSTLFNLISGRTSPDSGQVLLHGRPIQGLAPDVIHQRGLSRSFQITQVFLHMSVLDNLRCASLARHGQGLSPFKRLSRMGQLNRDALDLLDRLGLGARRHCLAHELSYAEQRALELGITLAGNPSVLLLDEPTSGMSRSETQQVVRLIRELTVGCTLLMVEHDMGVVSELAEQVAVMDQGRLIACDRPERIRSRDDVQRIYRTSQEDTPC